MERALELQEGTVALVRRLFRERKRLLAAHGVVAAGKLQQPSNLKKSSQFMFRRGRCDNFSTCSIARFLSGHISPLHVGQWDSLGKQSMHMR